MRQLVARAILTASSTALSLKTGSAPGSPRHVGHVFVLGASPKRVGQAQNAFVAVRNWQWTSSPMTGSNSARTSAGMSERSVTRRARAVREIDGAEPRELERCARITLSRFVRELLGEHADHGKREAPRITLIARIELH